MILLKQCLCLYTQKHCQFNIDPMSTVISMKTGLQVDRTPYNKSKPVYEVISPVGAERFVENRLFLHGSHKLEKAWNFGGWP